MFLILIACTANQSARSLTLFRAPPTEWVDASYNAALDTRGGCRTSEWMSSTLGNLQPTTGSAVSDNLVCQSVGLQWANIAELEQREEVVLLLEDWASSYPLTLGNFPTATREMLPDTELRMETLPGSQVRFEMWGPGVLDPELQVMVYGADSTWLLPQDGGAVEIGEDHVVVDFPAGLVDPIQVRFEAAWPTTVLDGEGALPFPLILDPGDSGVSLEVF